MDLPYCGADGFCHSTPQTPLDICPFEALLGRDSPELATLRLLRDAVLSSSTAGTRYSSLFYKHAFELNALLHSQPELRQRAYALIAALLPAAEELIVKNKAVIKKESLNELLSLFDDLSRRASPSLKRDFRGLQKEVRSGHVFKSLNITINTEY